MISYCFLNIFLYSFRNIFYFVYVEIEYSVKRQSHPASRQDNESTVLGDIYTLSAIFQFQLLSLIQGHVTPAS